jgi:chromosome segregation ATPase
MQMQEGGAFMNEGLLATLNAAIEAKNQELANAQALVQSLTQEKENLTQQVADLNSQVETLNNSHTSALEEKDNMIATLEQEKADLQTKVDENATAMENLQNELNGAKESLTTAQNTLAERDQQINDLNATIEDMKQDAGEGAQGGSPANNGQGAETPKVVVGCYVYNPDLTYEQNMEAEEKWNKEHGK